MLGLLLTYGMIAVVTSSCQGGSTSSRAISPRASVALAQQVDTVRLAAADHDTAAAQARLNQLRATVATLQAQGQISSGRAAQILAAATDVAAQLAGLPGTTGAPTTAPTVAPATAGRSSDVPAPGNHGGKKKK